MDAATAVELKNKTILTSTPHVHSKLSAQKAMWLVVISLLPPLVMGVIYFGLYQLVVVLAALAGAVMTESAIKYIRKQKITILDGSAIITGLLLGLIVPPGLNPVFAFIGSVVAIGFGKEVFGGLGYNIFNPALVGRAFLQAAYPVAMTTWSAPAMAVDTVTKATPLSLFKFEAIASKGGVDAMSLFLGNVGGSIGETSSIAILVGMVFLIAMKVLNWRVPLAMIVGLLLFSGIFWLIDPTKFASPIHHLFMGGFMFGAVYMASDWVTSPVTNKGIWIYGMAISLIVVMIRLFGGLPEGVMYAILIMNGFVPLINRYTKPVIFGAEK
ncbi:MAG: RnfABCDGE type electron transport complex subunit D [Ignavibacteriales bacterium]|jgi:electron transport complex protein RnfD|nr:RnfABCDGE type electron transport complex subunit D [Ignavibacteriales bacterium]MBK7267423.1 RnfABCDGE type electron transport complex subunit D [Ignavibacteriales bacterium]MBP7543672.1 RnfABCDGE type electron transport complex subunit D [Ignavibacteriaceae bacterium]MBP9123569.1 RnfABCDGE type electron transport complex subunit D [Ignavibacteriaceae bacterium]MCC6638535.1 RnfABCDGE type electron transport complex subunit D [Ignavibacteriaceae bacterium]